MSRYESQEDCECIVCEMVEEFRQVLKDGADWESGLRHVLHLTLSAKETVEDELVAEAIDDAFSEGFEEGVLSTLTQAQETMDRFVDDVTDRIYDIRDRRENPEDYADEIPVEKLEDLSDDQFDEIQENIRKSL